MRVTRYIYFLLFFLPSVISAQCTISYNGIPCVGNPIQFQVNVPGATNILWDFNGEGQDDKSAKPSYAFLTVGKKTVGFSCTLPGGTPCTSSLSLVVSPKPQVRVRMLSDSSQCYENNMFCFLDSSLSGNKDNCIKSIKYLFSDGELITKYGTKIKPVSLPSTICKSFVDPQGGSYFLVVEIEDCNGCIIKDTLPYKMKVEFTPAMFATFKVKGNACTGSADVTFKNGSQIKRSDVLKFRWIFDDGSVDSTNWDSVTHHYSIGNDMQKIFNPLLQIYTSVGCSRVFNLSQITLFNMRPYIVGSRDSICYGESINWKLMPMGIRSYIADKSIGWYMYPGISIGYEVSNTFNVVGPHVIRCTVQHPCGPFELLDTITVIGPKAAYEPAFIEPFRRYQCIIRDSVIAEDRSLFYHNDRDYLDDDSLFSEKAGALGHAFGKDPLTSRYKSLNAYDQDRGNTNVDRLWDFDDVYCQPCTTDRDKRQNSWLNCRYSKDNIDIHWYTPWDSVYRYVYTQMAFNLPYFDPVSKSCSGIRIWADDSLYEVRDTILNFGDNLLGLSARDSLIYGAMNKHKIPAGLFGDGVLDLPFDLRIYIPSGSSILIDKMDGSPQSQLNGPQFYEGAKYTRIITGLQDTCLFVYGLDIHRDLLMGDMIQPWHTVMARIPVPGLKPGDSINSDLHRTLFYDRIPKCFKMLLELKDTVHPFRCSNTMSANVALLPPSAKRLSMIDHFCYGYNNKVIDFQLTETKPGCMTSFAKFNPDYINTPDNWLLINDMDDGDIELGFYSNRGGRYLGYDAAGPATPTFFWVYNDTALSGTNPQSINVALIMGNGLDPDICVDTVYYKDFATFPRLDAGIIYAGTGKKTNYICKDTFVYVTIPPGSNHNLNMLANQSSWSLVDGVTLDTQEMVLESYYRVKDHVRYPGQKVNYTVIERYRIMNGLLALYKTDTVITAIVHVWKAIALPGAGYNDLREDLAAKNMNIDDFGPENVLDLVWNQVGTIGVPSTGSKGCIDTTGYGYKLDYYYEILSSTLLDEKDSILLPADMAKVGLNAYRAYNFRPRKKGIYRIIRNVSSFFPTYCPVEGYVDLAVGFHAKVSFSDTIICAGKLIEATPDFRYYDLNPTTFGALDTNDQWYRRQNEAGQKNREGFTIWDFSRQDDNPANPSTMFGNMPYARRGYRNPGMLLGNEPGGIYYRSPGRFTLRVATSDSSGCADTLSQDLYVTGARAGFYIDIVKPECHTIIELFDTSFIDDPCVARGQSPCDFIYSRTIRWGDGTVSEYLKTAPKQIGHDYSINGRYRIWLIIETVLGCRDSVFQDIFIPGPVPLFTPETSVVICVGDSVRFKNRTPEFSSSSSWVWNYGDGFFAPQSDTTNIYHTYMKTGMFDVYLNQYDSIANTGKYCGAVYPDVLSGQQKITVTVLPYDKVSLVAEPEVVCVGDSIQVKATLESIHTYTQYNWTFNKKIYHTPGLGLRIVPSRKGKYVISWEADTIGMTGKFCPAFDTLVVYADSILADFTIDQSQEPVFCFNNTSSFAVSYRWGFYHDADISLSRGELKVDEQQKEPDRNICRNFVDHPGISWVCLEATNSLGCKDTVCKKLENNYEMIILPPNVFTPNGGDGFIGQDKDGLQGNNVFNIYTKNVEYYHLQIFDRWGILVFESHDTRYDWNGSIHNSGKQCPDGTYYYILDYSYKGREKHEPVINGVVKLIW